MEYLEWLEHFDTLMKTWGVSSPGTVNRDLFHVVQSEIQNERQRGELAIKLSELPDRR